MDGAAPNLSAELRDKQLIESVFMRLRDANRKLKAGKCHFVKSDVNYLGHIGSRQGLHPDSEKVQVVAEFSVPVDKDQLRIFLGMAGYYRRFTTGLSQMAVSMYVLLTKEVQYQWSEECAVSRKHLRKSFSTAAALALQGLTLLSSCQLIRVRKEYEQC